MAYIREKRGAQTTMFPLTLDELIPGDHVCRVIEAFVGRLKSGEAGLVRAEPAETGRPGYDPRDLLQLSGRGQDRLRSLAEEAYQALDVFAEPLPGRTSPRTNFSLRERKRRSPI